MKNISKVKNDRISKIELNNLIVLEYESYNDVKCLCIKCNYQIIDNYRNLSYKKFKCKYCDILPTIKFMNNEVKLLEIKGSFLFLECKNGHKYKQDRRNFLANKKCKQCYLDKKTISKEEIINNIESKHGNYYKYDFSNYKNIHSKIEIICNKGHKFLQKVSNHLQGKGCPICRESFGERTITKFLEDNNIEFIRQKKFENCKHINVLPFDFYIPDIEIVIEYDGIQHFKSVKMFGGELEFEKTKIRDKIKDEYCKSNNIHLFRISYLENLNEKLLHIYEFIIFQSQVCRI